MNIHFGFIYIGLIFLLMLMILNYQENDVIPYIQS